MKTFGAAVLALMALQVSCYPQDDSAEAGNHEQEGYVDLLNIDLEVNHDPGKDVQGAVKEIIGEDWADTWDPPKELKEWFPYRITGKDEEGAVGEYILLARILPNGMPIILLTL